MRKKLIAFVIVMITFISVAAFVLILTIPPINLRRTNFNYQMNSKIPMTPETYCMANVKVMEKAVVHIEEVDASKIAVYNAYIEHNGKKYPFTITIEDKMIPVVTLKEGSALKKCFLNDSFAALDLVDVVDDSETEVFFVDGDNELETLTMKEVGSFDYFIVARDASGNTSAKIRVRFEVKIDNKKPTLSGVDNVTIQVGDSFDPYEGVMAIDDVDGDITDEIGISGKVDTNLVGQYTLTYRVSDSSGNTTTVERLVSVTSSGYSGSADVDNGPFLTSSEIEERDRQIEKLNTTTLEFFNENNYLEALNRYLMKHFSQSREESSYSVIIKHEGTRHAMARAVKLLLDQRGIDSIIVKGNGYEMYWNLVFINGAYRHLDIYENATTQNENACYLLKTSELDDYHAYDEASYPKSH